MASLCECNASDGVIVSLVEITRPDGEICRGGRAMLTEEERGRTSRFAKERCEFYDEIIHKRNVKFKQAICSFHTGNTSRWKMKYGRDWTNDWKDWEYIKTRFRRLNKDGWEEKEKELMDADELLVNTDNYGSGSSNVAPMLHRCLYMIKTFLWKLISKGAVQVDR